MDKIEIIGGKKLFGEVKISGAKNFALPAMFASLLTDKEIEITNYPHLEDINTAIKLLEIMGVSIKKSKDRMLLRAEKIKSYSAPYDIVRKMRASVLALGPLTARFGKARISLPGGCAIGARPVDLHIKGLEKLGARIDIDHGYVVASCKKLKGSEIYFDKKTVTGTMNIMMAASLAQGDTLIENCAIEPEVTELAKMLNKMGAKIKGEGTERLEIRGVNSLNGTKIKIIPDRVETGTYLCGCAIVGGKIKILDCEPKHVESVLVKLSDTGQKITTKKNKITIESTGNILPTNIATDPFPGFPTDMQAQFMALLSLAKGTSKITESIFENRFMHAVELARMGADIDIQGNTAIVKGSKILSGANVMATDLRASASLVLAGLAAHGKTIISRVYHLDRGYERIEEKFRALGGEIRRDEGR